MIKSQGSSKAQGTKTSNNLRIGVLGLLGAWILVLEIFLAPAAQAAVMSSSSYKIQIDSVNAGGSRATSSSYVLEQTSGETGTARITGSSNNLWAGFQLPVVAAPSPAPSPAPSGGGPAFIPFEILDIVAQRVGSDSAVVTFRTNKNATTEIHVGTTPGEYDRTVVVTAEPNSSHSILLGPLAPNTPYYFEITAESHKQEQARSGARIFKTLPLPGPPEKEPPANVRNFTAQGLDKQIRLEWENPADSDFAGVRIARSGEFYPANPFDGVLIYTGPGEQFVDTGLENGRQYYYTAFAYDTDGNFASGAIATAAPAAPGVTPPVLPPDPPLVPPELIPESLEDLSLPDFDFVQDGVKLPITAGRVEAKPDEPLTIAIDYDKVPEVLKTVLVTLEDKEGKAFSFLLRVDEEKNRYLATLHPPASGAYVVTLTVVDYKNQGLQKVQGELRVAEALGTTVVPPREDGFARFLPELGLFFALALVFLALWFGLRMYMRRKSLIMNRESYG